MRARGLLLVVLVVGCRKATPDVRPDDQKSAPTRVTCTLPSLLGQDGDAGGPAEAKVPPRCDLRVEQTIRLLPGARLEIGAGAKLVFAKDAGISVQGGALVARGTASEPIVFAGGQGVTFYASRRYKISGPPSSDAGPLDAEPPPVGVESVIEQARLEGGRVEVGYLSLDRVALADVTIQTGKASALLVRHPGIVTMKRVHTGEGIVELPISMYPMLGEEQAGEIRLHGSTGDSLKLRKHAQPILLTGPIRLMARTGPTTFEVESGSTLRFAPSASLRLEGDHPIKMIAKGVTFTSEARWQNIVFGDKSEAEIDGCTFEHAKGSLFAAVLRLPSDDKAMHITGNTFRDNDVAAFEADKCSPWKDPAKKNTSAGKPLCEEGMLGVLGSLGSLFGPMPSKSAPLAFPHEPIDDLTLGGYGVSGLGTGGLGASGVGGYGEPKPSTARVVESSITATGGLPVEVVRKIVRGNVSSLKGCAKASGSLTVTFSIDTTGKVTLANATGGTLTDPSARTCAASAFSGMSFPQADTATSVTATHEHSP